MVKSHRPQRKTLLACFIVQMLGGSVAVAELHLLPFSAWLQHKSTGQAQKQILLSWKRIYMLVNGDTGELQRIQRSP